MTYKTYRCYSSLKRALAGIRPDDHPVVSVDVFDTILFRRVFPYDSVWRAVCRELRERLLIAGHTVSLKDVIAARERAFAELHKEAEQAGKDPDALLRNVIPRWLQKLIPVGALDLRQWTEWLVRRELELETEATFANRELLSPLRDLRNRGFRLVYLSDMYLGKEIIGQLLDANGFGALFDEGYVSADVGKLKRTGRIFEHVLQQENLQPEQLLHIGDNPVADGKVPASLGIRAWLLRMHGDRAMRYFFRKAYHLVRKDPDAAGLLADDFARVKTNFRLHPLEELGFAAYGPIYSTYLLALCERARADGVDHIYFAAREGFTLIRMFEHISRAVWPSGKTPPAEYLYVSRKSLMQPNAPYPTVGCMRQVEIAMRTAPRTLETVLRVLGVHGLIPPEVLQDCGFASEAALLPRDWSASFPLQRLLSHPEFLAVFRKAAEEAQRELLLYLQQIDFFRGGRAVFGNVGLLGKEFENLASTVCYLNDAPRMECCLLGLFGLAAYEPSPRYGFHGLLASQCLLLWNANSMRLAPFLLENPLRGPHGSTHAYRAGRPVLDLHDYAPRGAEARFDADMGLLQFGILRYAAEFSAFVRLTGFTRDRFGPMARSTISSLVALPSRDVAALWLDMQMDPGMGTDTSYRVRAKPLRLHSLLNPFRFRRLLQQQFWSFGSVAEMGVPGLSTLCAAWFAFRFAFADPSCLPNPQLPAPATAPAPRAPVDPSVRAEQPWERENWESFLRQWEENLERGRCAPSRLKHKRRILTLRVVLRQEIARAITNIVCRVKKKPQFPRDGIGIRTAFRYALLRLFARLGGLDKASGNATAPNVKVSCDCKEAPQN